MSWIYSESTDDNIIVVLGTMTNQLSALTPDQSATSKVAASNQRAGDARGLVVWTSDFPTPPPVPTSGFWRWYTWHTDHDYRSMYDSLVNSLSSLQTPDGQSLTSAQAYYAVISMSNQWHGQATLSLFWRS